MAVRSYDSLGSGTKAVRGTLLILTNFSLSPSLDLNFGLD